MELNELERLKKYVDEGDLIEIAEEIGDKITFRGYSQEQIICLATALVEINLLPLNYETKEQILNVLCHATAYYDIRNKICWKSIIDIKDKLEEALKEYVEELISKE